MKIKPILISLLASASLGVVVASSMVATFVATKTIETYTLQSLDNDNNLSTVLANSGEKLTLNTINENNRKKSDVVYSIDGDDYQQYLQLKDNVLLCKNTPLATRSYNIIASDANNPSRTIATTKIRIIPSPTSLKIYGNDKIAVQIGAREGSLQYLLDDNTGQSVVGGTWSVTADKYSNFFTISNTGLLSWRGTFPEIQNFNVRIRCEKAGYDAAYFVVTFQVYSSVPQDTSISIYGSAIINGVVGGASNSNYTAVTNTGQTVADATWTLTNAVAGITIDNGTLNWTDSLAQGTYQFSIQCAKVGLESGKIDVTLNILASSSTATLINIYGSNTVTGTYGTAGTAKYTAVNNAGQTVVDGTWTLIDNVPTGVTIDNGVLSWTDKLKVGQYQFNIQCAKTGLESGKIAVTLTIQSDAPTATSINIYGSDLPAGTLGISGNAKYTAVTNTGTTITDGTWALSSDAPSGVTIDNGTLNWTSALTLGKHQFTIRCDKTGLKTGELIVGLTIQSDAPKPTAINIYGSDAPTGTFGISGSANYTAVTNTGQAVTDATWAISGSNLPDGISIDSNGVVGWNNSLALNEYSFTVKCSSKTGLSGEKAVQLKIQSDEPASSSINIYGNDTAVGIQGTAGSTKYICTTNTGVYVTDGKWSIASPGISGVSITADDNGNGVLSWTDSMPLMVSLPLTINCSKDGLLVGTKQIHFSIVSTMPSPTSIRIYGADTIYGKTGEADYERYEATNNLGQVIADGKWTLSGTHPTNTTIDNSGKLSWSNTTPGGSYTFSINCTSGSFSATLIINLIIFNNPIPTHINIFGSSTIAATSGRAGNTNYIAVDNTGTTLTGLTWSLSTDAPLGVSIDANGTLSWTSNIASNVYRFNIVCNKSGFPQSTLSVALSVQYSPDSEYSPAYVYNTADPYNETNSMITIPTGVNERNDIRFNLPNLTVNNDQRIIFGYTVTASSDDQKLFSILSVTQKFDSVTKNAYCLFDIKATTDNLAYARNAIMVYAIDRLAPGYPVYSMSFAMDLNIHPHPY